MSDKPENSQEIQLPVILRDYFAAAAMQGMLCGHLVLPGSTRTTTDESVAATAYSFADAMIKARQQ